MLLRHWRENEILQIRETPNVIPDLDGSNIGEKEGLGIPSGEFDGVLRPKADRLKRYELWADLSLVKAAITFGQLLEISPMARRH